MTRMEVVLRLLGLVDGLEGNEELDWCRRVLEIVLASVEEHTEQALCNKVAEFVEQRIAEMDVEMALGKQGIAELGPRLWLVKKAEKEGEYNDHN